MRAGVVVPHIHRRCLRRPEPRGHLRGRLRRVTNLQPRGKRLPEIFYTDREPAADIADEGQSRRPPARIRKHPCTLRISALGDRESLGCRLRQRVVAPNRVLLFLIVRIETPALDPLARSLGDVAAARLDGLGPETAVGSGETHVPVVSLLAHRHRKRQADATNKILLLIAVEHERVHDADRLLPCIKIQPHAERQPLARTVHRLVHSLHFNDRADRPRLLDRDLVDVAQKFIAPRHRALLHVGPILQDTHELPRARHFASAHRERLDQIFPGREQPGLHRTRVDFDYSVALL